MGRVKRIRNRKKKHEKNRVTINANRKYLKLIKWMKKHGWKSTCRLVSAYFQNTGRGLMAKERIFADSAIVKIPCHLLITVKTVTESRISWIFSKDRSFLTQQVISSFLVWEEHLGKSSNWKNYIGCLPKTFSCPAFCDDITWIPNHLRGKVEKVKETIKKTLEIIVDRVCLKKCDHCGMTLDAVFNYEQYLWAWCVVSTRAVYLCPDLNAMDSIWLSDENNLALAPYIDLFNHHYDAEVKASVIQSEGVYQIETIKPFSKNQEVFINYGPLSNDRLLINYGFVIPYNIQDQIFLTYEEILEAVEEIIPLNKHINKYRYRFLQNKNMFKTISCHSSGLSWDCQAVIYVFACPTDMRIEDIKQNIFSNKFKNESAKDICEIAEIIINRKANEYDIELRRLENLKDVKEKYTDCYFSVCTLVKEYIEILKKCSSYVSAKQL